MRSCVPERRRGMHAVLLRFFVRYSFPMSSIGLPKEEHPRSETWCLSRRFRTSPAEVGMERSSVGGLQRAIDPHTQRQSCWNLLHNVRRRETPGGQRGSQYGQIMALDQGIEKAFAKLHSILTIIDEIFRTDRQYCSSRNRANHRL